MERSQYSSIAAKNPKTTETEKTNIFEQVQLTEITTIAEYVFAFLLFPKFMPISKSLSHLLGHNGVTRERGS